MKLLWLLVLRVNLTVVGIGTHLLIKDIKSLIPFMMRWMNLVIITIDIISQSIRLDWEPQERIGTHGKQDLLQSYFLQARLLL
mgnify:CR=1 FL=1